MNEKPRLPPGQGLIRRPENWPILGETGPRDDDTPWAIRVTGAVERPLEIPLEELMRRPRKDVVLDIHCVTRWSKYDRSFSGFPLMKLIEEAGPKPEARFVRFISRSERAHDTSLTLPLCEELQPLITFDAEGEPLEEVHGGPVRIVTPGRYFYKSVKWLEEIELREENKLGYWEAGPGYHDNADPWAEERFITGNIPPDLRERMIERKSLGKRDLLGVDFSGEALGGLDAAKAVIRNCRFVGAKLRSADFREAMVSGGSFEEADMVDADFRDANCNGTSFVGADLRSVDFSGAQVFGARFVDEDGGRGAIVDAQTLLSPEQLASLTDANRRYLEAALAAAP
ncbi:molybdopterin-dependent oxidoreductase [Pikeienuella piscinae]|uniref:Molybdopterin-dependent oxidoreductase n=1 Tax=Pikeienuella piscinae TaxID=2748098 RepID=A0A7L5BUA5_9RHOB|nr:molybdopterin-dependent oxidoreductase [Pikeienuella piscinae]QIE54801.1 molybdopterin-dependent oxidoreductase [Pikeienuella piscinae]